MNTGTIYGNAELALSAYATLSTGSTQTQTIALQMGGDGLSSKQGRAEKRLYRTFRRMSGIRRITPAKNRRIIRPTRATLADPFDSWQHGVERQHPCVWTPEHPGFRPESSDGMLAFEGADCIRATLADGGVLT